MRREDAAYADGRRGSRTQQTTSINAPASCDVPPRPRPGPRDRERERAVGWGREPRRRRKPGARVKRKDLERQAPCSFFPEERSARARPCGRGRSRHGLSLLLVSSGADQLLGSFSVLAAAAGGRPVVQRLVASSPLLSWSPVRRCDGRRLAMMDQEHLDFIMRHQHQGGMGFAPADRGDSEEALGSSESEPAGRPRGKRARAAEVHNLSEKRRRCKINEKMKALQSLVPDSSKTDKASMLDDAIEYLKHLQLQVQMLSMRNGVYRPSVNLPGAPDHLPTSQMCAALNQNSVDASSNRPAAMLPMSHFLGAMSGTRHPFGPPNQDRPRHEPLVLSSVPCTTTREPPFLLGPSQESPLRSLQLTLPAEMIFQEEAMLKHRLSSTQETTSMPVGHEIKQPVRQETPAERAGHFDACSIWKNQSHDMTPNNPESVLFAPHFRRN
ncbi:hypothetical protein VPH35_113328 [Triticum aestivum]|uniref:uncharacterized protein isoform X2 n=1 Tax=Triticum aestivum TaxID=4565 RepID=UPI000842D5F7|nr:uncharacterized protein LOC123139398 isoform X2 [Triticum aestivum]